MTGDLPSLREQIRQFTKDRDWEQFHDAKNLAMCLAAEVGELVAELRWVPTAGIAAALDEPARRARIEAEIGDTLISLVMLADAIGADLVETGLRKLEHNAAKYPPNSARGRPDVPPGTPPEAV